MYIFLEGRTNIIKLGIHQYQLRNMTYKHVPMMSVCGQNVIRIEMVSILS